MKRKLLATLVGTALLGVGTNLALAQTAKAGALSGDKVKIAVMNDMSGLYADIGGPGSVEAAKMAIADFGGKVLGKPVELVFADHLNKPDVGSNKAREWYDTEGVDVIVDVPTSSVAIAVAKVAAEKKHVFISTGAASTRLTNEDCNAYTVHYAYDTYALANGTGKAIVQTGGKTWFFLTADYAFGKSLEADTSAVVKANGGTVLGHVLHPLSTSDFSSYVLQAQASKAQIIGLANAGGDTINSVKAANEFGLTKTQNLAGLLLFITDIHSLGLKTAHGMMLTSAWYWDQNDESRKFGKRFFEQMKRMPTFDQAAVYSAVTTYLKAVKATGTDDADKIMAELKKTRINDIFAKNAYIRQDGRLIKDMYLMQVKEPGESKYPWDYYKLKKTIPAEEAFQPLSKSTCPMIKK